jgi:hypothetical protein
MLEHGQFLIRKQADCSPLASQYSILDDQTQEPLGSARVRPGWLARWCAGWPGTRLLPVRLDVCETDDEPLVFTVHRGLGRKRAQIADADDQCVGRLVARGSDPAAGFWILDRSGDRFVTVEFNGAAFILWDGVGRKLAAWRQDGVDWHVSLEPLLDDLPLVKMLLLGSALALGLMFP